MSTGERRLRLTQNSPLALAQIPTFYPRANDGLVPDLPKRESQRLSQVSR